MNYKESQKIPSDKKINKAANSQCIESTVYSKGKKKKNPT